MRKRPRRDTCKQEKPQDPSIKPKQRGAYAGLIRQGFKDLGIDALPPTEPTTLKGFLQIVDMMLDLSERLNEIAKRKKRTHEAMAKTEAQIIAKLAARLNELASRQRAMRGQAHEAADSSVIEVTRN